MKTLFSLSTIVLLLSLVAPNFAKATSFYVDPSSTASVTNGSLAYPWKTIAQMNSGTTLLNPGDTVFFKRGQTFSGRLQISRSGTAAAPIVYTNYGTGTLPVFDNAISDIINLSGRQYVIIDGIKITDNSISATDHSVQAKISYAINVDNSPNCTIRNTDISLVGVGISVTAGSDNTTITGNYMHNMRMVRNTPTTVNPDDDYGANPMVIGSSNNSIMNNRFEECWASSYDYGFDGGAVELFGTTMNNNKIMYNTAINCNGFMEVGSSSNGVALNNIIAYNKIINCGIIGVYQNGSTFTVTVNGLQYYNNTVIETKKQYSQSSVMFWMAGTGSAGMVTVKNNIFWLSSGVNFASSKFASGQMIHTNNIYRMSAGSLGFTQTASELLSSTANLFQNTSGDPSVWNLSLLSTSPAINFGTNVSLVKDFIGNPISGNPDAGLLEFQSAPVLVVSPLVASIANTSIKCYGDSSQVTVSASGGTAPYIGTGIFKVAAGNYTYIVSDAKGLKDTVALSVTQPSKLISAATAGPIAVYGGSTTVSLSGSSATSPYTYSFNNGLYQTGNIFSNVLAGNYPYAVKDANGCISSAMVSITQPALVVVSPLVASAVSGQILCNGGSTSLVVSATGGTQPYTGIGTFSVVAGNHSYIVSDAKGLKDTVALTISQPTKLVVSATAGVIAAYGGTTSVSLTGSGGIAPYMFSFNNATYQSSNTFSGIGAGTYPYAAKDANGCLASSAIVVTQPAQVIVQPLVASVVVGKINCNGGSTTAVVSATGGVLPYTGTGSFTVVAGTYSYIVSDAAGKKDTVTFALVQPTAIAASVTTGTISTTGGTASAVINASGGTSPYLFNMDGGNYQSANTFSGLLAGTHTYSVKDNAGCMLSKSFTLADYVAPVVTTVTTTTYVRYRVYAYPNPSTSYFTVSLKYHGSMNVFLTAYDMHGQLVYSANGNAYSTYTFGGNFIAGTYFLKVNIGGTVQTVKLLKL